jgi:hypothetical protein
MRRNVGSRVGPQRSMRLVRPRGGQPQPAPPATIDVMCLDGLRAPLSICICLPLPPFQHAAALPLRSNDAPPPTPPSSPAALRCARGVPRPAPPPAAHEQIPLLRRSALCPHHRIDPVGSPRSLVHAQSRTRATTTAAASPAHKSQAASALAVRRVPPSPPSVAGRARARSVVSPSPHQNLRLSRHPRPPAGLGSACKLAGHAQAGRAPSCKEANKGVVAAKTKRACCNNLLNCNNVVRTYYSIVR